MKKLVVGALAFFLILGGVVLTAHAEHEGKCSRDGGQKECPLMSKGDCGGKGESECPIVKKLMKKAGFYLENAEAIGLSDDQVNQIKAIKLDAKKEMILGGAQMQVAMLEMESKLKSDTVDVEAFGQMIDKNLAEMGAGAKKMVQFYAALKQILTVDQKKKAKEIWKASEKQAAHA